MAAAGGQVVAIGDDDVLWRRLHAKHLTLDHSTGERRITSAAFTDPQLSVDLARLVAPRDHRVTMAHGAGVAELAAHVPRSKQLEVRHDPVPDNEAHSLVTGRKTQSIARFLARKSRLLI